MLSYTLIIGFWFFPAQRIAAGNSTRETTLTAFLIIVHNRPLSCTKSLS